MSDAIDIHNLIRAFKELGGGPDGRINYQKLSSALQQKIGMSELEVANLLEVDSCRIGDELDFLSLCSSLLRTKVLFDRIASECEKQVPSSSRKVNSRTFTRRKGSGKSATGVSAYERRNVEDPHVVALKGCFFDSEPSAGLCGHRYLLELEENSPVEIVAQAIDKKGCLSPSPAVEVMMFQENDETNKKLLTFSSFIDSEGYCSIKMNLKKGKYLLVPVTLKWKAGASSPDPPVSEPMIDTNDAGEPVLTESCRDALKAIFDCTDLSRNGSLSQLEFDLFIQYICGESAADEWATVQDNFDTVNGELTLDGFLNLYQMAIVTDPRDAAYMFSKMGLVNSKLEKAFMFLLTVNARVTVPILKPLPVSVCDSLMEEVFRKTAIEQGFCSKVRNMNDLLLYTHKLPHRVTIVVQNQSHSTVKVKLDCTNSENCVSHVGSLECIAEVGPGKSVIGHHLFPDNHLQSWSVQCIESLVE